MEEKKILITGGSGFVGRHMVKMFSDKGYRVKIFDITEPKYPLDKNTEFIKGDIFDIDSVTTAVKDTGAVIHLVGLADAGAAQKNPMKSFQLNIVSLQNILEACRICGNKKIIFPSSAAVYGITEDLPIKENFPVSPTNIYSAHKVLCEKMVQAYQKNYGVNYVVLRFFNVYGKGNEGVIGIFLDKAKKGETIESFGPFQYRDFIYAGDVANAVYMAVAHDKATNRIINIGSGRGIQMREILNLVCEFYPQAKWVEKKADFTMYDSIADITLAKILLDFTPDSSFGFLKRIVETEMKD
ncbi:NAD-dependent epimerase/dehydratase family protein [Methanoregula sp.]|uniref:NAD-dependent epimerase/dehydratase family protein n=1 Tax=Methanoregula sp. TaxID=2052170 RepID=UPI003C738C2A